MNTLSQEKLLEQLQWRYAVKKFDPARKISEKDWETLENSLILTPSSYGLQPWKFIVVQDPQVRKSLTPLSWNQTQVEDCSHFVVFASRKHLDIAYIDHFIAETARIRAVPKENLEGYKKMMAGDLLNGPRSKIIPEWATRQTYIALGNLMTCAALLGIDTCPMEGIDPARYDEVLKLKDSEYFTVVACAVGYRSKDDKYSLAKKIRFDKSRLLQYI